MERRKLTKEDIDKVRDVEGFPLGTDEDIIALSDAPYYTACPNPFIKEFVEEYGHPYDEATDDYHCLPFASDVSEGKSDAIYNAHTYHTKVPYKAIMRYIKRIPICRTIDESQKYSSSAVRAFSFPAAESVEKGQGVQARQIQFSAYAPIHHHLSSDAQALRSFSRLRSGLP